MKNVKDCGHRGLVNGARGTMFSITWNERDHDNDNVRAWYDGTLEGGKIYKVSSPYAITMKMKKTGDLFPVVRGTKDVDTPKWMRTWFNFAKKLKLKTHEIDLGFAFTDYKVQGLTLDKLIIVLNKQGARHDLATIYVGISRVTRLQDLRIW